MRARDYIFENFISYFPLVAKRTIDWHITGPLEITAELDDGSRVIYDDTIKSIINLKFDDENITEILWKKEFARRLNKWLMVRGMTQDDLADATGISRRTINKYATGSSTPSSFALRAIAKVLDCEPGELINF